MVYVVAEDLAMGDSRSHMYTLLDTLLESQTFSKCLKIDKFESSLLSSNV